MIYCYTRIMLRKEYYIPTASLRTSIQKRTPPRQDNFIPKPLPICSQIDAIYVAELEQANLDLQSKLELQKKHDSIIGKAHATKLDELQNEITKLQENLFRVNQTNERKSPTRTRDSSADPYEELIYNSRGEIHDLKELLEDSNERNKRLDYICRQSCAELRVVKDENTKLRCDLVERCEDITSLDSLIADFSLMIQESQNQNEALEIKIQDLRQRSHNVSNDSSRNEFMTIGWFGVQLGLISDDACLDNSECYNDIHYNFEIY